jgi:dCMP deaminase
MGYNGVRAGAQHCSDYFGSGGADISGHREWSARFEIHAEMNALLKCKENLAGATLYTLFSPCSQCAKNIVAAGIKKVVYREPYKREFYAGCATLEMSGVELCHCARQ